MDPNIDADTQQLDLKPVYLVIQASQLELDRQAKLRETAGRLDIKIKSEKKN